MDEAIINDFVDRLKQGQFTFDKVRPELERMGKSEPEISLLVRTIDERLQQSLASGVKHDYSRSFILLGQILTAIGVFFTLGSVLDFFGNVWILAAGPISGGIALWVAGVRLRAKNNEALENKPTINQRFRRSRD